jgi:hypothetical protein
MHDASYSFFLWVLVASLGKIRINQNLCFAAGNKIRKLKLIDDTSRQQTG